MRRFRALALATAVAVYGQIVLGGVVRITGSGLGCPDWPACQGRLVPDFLDYHVSIEYTHRLLGTAAGILVLATAVIALAMYLRGADTKMPSGLAWASVSTVGLIVLQGVLGGITVLTGNTPFTVAIHLGNALLVLASSVLVVLWAGRVAAGDRRVAAVASTGRWAPIAIHGAVVAAFAVVLSGAYVVGSSAGGACAGWPLCGAPGRSTFTDIHMLHRVVVLFGSAAILAGAYVAWRHWRGAPIAWAASVTALLLLVEVAVGAAQAVLGLPRCAAGGPRGAGHRGLHRDVPAGSRLAPGGPP